MRGFGRVLGRLLLAVLALVLLLLSPVAYVEFACRGAGPPAAYTALLPSEAWRAESRTLLTYPEWHIVHAYDDYAEVIRAGDPHDFGFARATFGFWSSLCALSRQAGAHGGVDWPTKRMVHVIGVSFTAELALKAAYEETLGRVATWLRGTARAPLDDLSAQQAEAYATFLQQVPWHQWDFLADNAALHAAATPAFRDRERAFALGVETRVKAAYAGVIASAVAGIGPDALTMRVVIAGVDAAALADLPGVSVLATTPAGLELETPRYRAFTDLARILAERGARFVEIAGNDDILFTAITDQPDMPEALHSFARQGHPGWRHLVLVKVPDLARHLQTLGPRLEHIHDY